MQAIIQQLINHIGQLRLRTRGQNELTPDQAAVCDQAIEQARQLLAELRSAPEATNPVALDVMNFTYHCGDIPNCQPLRVFRNFSSRQHPEITSAWQLSAAALAQVVASGGIVYLTMFSPEQVPVWIDGFHRITPELQDACQWPNGGEPSQEQTAEHLQKSQAQAVSQFAATFIAGQLRALGYDPNLVESDGVFFQPHVENIGRAAMEFFALWPDQCNDETVATICGRNDTLLRGMDGYSELRQALDAWTDDSRVAIVKTGTGEAQAAVDTLVAEALPPRAIHEKTREYLGLVWRKYLAGGPANLERFSDQHNQAIDGALTYFLLHNSDFTLEQLAGYAGMKQLGSFALLEGFPRLQLETQNYLVKWRAYQRDPKEGPFSRVKTTPWRESAGLAGIIPERELLDVLLDVAEKQKADGNDLPAQLIADMTMKTLEAQALLAAYIGEYHSYNEFPAGYQIDRPLFMQWFKRQPYAAGISGKFLAAIETAAAQILLGYDPKAPGAPKWGASLNKHNYAQGLALGTIQRPADLTAILDDFAVGSYERAKEIGITSVWRGEQTTDVVFQLIGEKNQTRHTWADVVLLICQQWAAKYFGSPSREGDPDPEGTKELRQQLRQEELDGADPKRFDESDQNKPHSGDRMGDELTRESGGLG